MTFTSSIFWVFIFIVFLLYFLIPKKLQWLVLLIASYSFYLSSGFGLVIFLLFVTTVTFYSGIVLEGIDENSKLFLEKNKETLNKDQQKKYKQSNKKKKKLVIAIALLLVFGILGVLKYYNFFAINLNQIAWTMEKSLTFPTMNFLLPLGISFYTFQSVGYIIDVNRGKVAADKNFAKFALFLSFFPQIVQGPIGRYDELAHQLYKTHSFDYNRVKFGFQLVLWGLFKKMVIADRLAIAVDSIFDNYFDYEGFSIFIGVIFFSFQMYCDFSGGIDVASGIAEAMGINLAENFKRPFFSTSIDEYWRRWHITLGAWMREYVFYPLCLSRSFIKLGRFIRKIFGNYLGKIIPILTATIITFLAVGVWHGPSWKYVAFGLFYGVLISIGTLLSPVTKTTLNKLEIKTNSLSWRLFQIGFVFLATTIGRYFARAEGLRDALSMLKRTFTKFNPWVLYDGTFLELGLDRADYYVVFISIFILIIVEILQEKGFHLRAAIANQNLTFRWLLYLLGIFGVIIFGIYGMEYNSADFIYQGFLINEKNTFNY